MRRALSLTRSRCVPLAVIAILALAAGSPAHANVLSSVLGESRKTVSISVTPVGANTAVVVVTVSTTHAESVATMTGEYIRLSSPLTTTTFVPAEGFTVPDAGCSPSASPPCTGGGKFVSLVTNYVGQQIIAESCNTPMYVPNTTATWPVWPPEDPAGAGVIFIGSPCSYGETETFPQV